MSIARMLKNGPYKEVWGVLIDKITLTRQMVNIRPYYRRIFLSQEITPFFRITDLTIYFRAIFALGVGHFGPWTPKERSHPTLRLKRASLQESALYEAI